MRPDELIDRFGADSVRYFLLREMVFGQDANFSDEAFVDRYNSDLANDLGNTVSRLVTLSRSAFDGRTPPHACGDNELAPVAKQAVEDYRAAMGDLAFSRALESLWRLLAETNQYIVSQRALEADQDRGAHPEARPRPVERPRGGADRGHRPAPRDAAGGAAGARRDRRAEPPDQLRRAALGRAPHGRRDPRAGAPLPAHRQGGLPR